FLGYAPERQGKAVAIYVLPEQPLPVGAVGMTDAGGLGGGGPSAAQTFSPAVTPAPATAKSVSERLTELRDLYDRGLMSQEEYERKREAVLEGL
ncbi:MAG: SHOCT domain-containing protein, partial [Candidatus Binatia bacterium]